MRRTTNRNQRVKRVFNITDFRMQPTKKYAWTVIATIANSSPIYYHGIRKWWPSEWDAQEYAKTILKVSPTARLVAVQGQSLIGPPSDVKITKLPILMSAV